VSPGRRPARVRDAYPRRVSKLATERRADERMSLSRVGRSWRIVLLGALVALFVAGSLKGDDPWWPFGPWRMFSTSQAPTGAVVAMAIQAETTEGVWFDAALSPANVGLNRAEVEGRIPQILADPAMLGTLAKSHSRLRPHDAPWVGVRLVRRASVIVDRVPTGRVDSSVLATWTTHGVTTVGNH
jgi:hypothetical protein